MASPEIKSNTVASQPSGLTTAEAKRGLLQYGPNAPGAGGMQETGPATAAQLLTDGPTRDPGEDPFDAELLDNMRATYLELLPARAAVIRDVADLPALAKAAHLLAGASAQFGYPGLATLCRGVERTARSGERAPELVEAVLAAAAHVQSTSR